MIEMHAIKIWTHTHTYLWFSIIVCSGAVGSKQRIDYVPSNEMNVRRRYEKMETSRGDIFCHVYMYEDEATLR